MAKDQQANQNQLMGANASQQTPSYSPQMGANAQMGAQANQNQLSQMGAQANQNQLSQMGAAAQMAMNARPQMGAQANFSAMNARPQMGMNANARSIWGSPPPLKGQQVRIQIFKTLCENTSNKTQDHISNKGGRVAVH